jgi:hypothetical protein
LADGKDVAEPEHTQNKLKIGCKNDLKYEKFRSEVM